jgi:hypothetical protein
LAAPIRVSGRDHLRQGRRRTKVIGRFPGETSALCLIWLELASRGLRGITMTPKAVAEIERFRRALAAGESMPETHLRREGDRCVETGAD